MRKIAKWEKSQNGENALQKNKNLQNGKLPIGKIKNIAKRQIWEIAKIMKLPICKKGELTDWKNGNIAKTAKLGKLR